jgi:hypothetical protein
MTHNDYNYTALGMIKPPLSIEDRLKILININLKSVAELSRKISVSHTAINRVLAGENLPAVRLNILKALAMTTNPWEPLK